MSLQKKVTFKQLWPTGTTDLEICRYSFPLATTFVNEASSESGSDATSARKSIAKIYKNFRFFEILHTLQQKPFFAFFVSLSYLCTEILQNIFFCQNFYALLKKAKQKKESFGKKKQKPSFGKMEKN